MARQLVLVHLTKFLSLFVDVRIATSMEMLLCCGFGGRRGAIRLARGCSCDEINLSENSWQYQENKLRVTYVGLLPD